MLACGDLTVHEDSDLRIERECLGEALEGISDSELVNNVSEGVMVMTKQEYERAVAELTQRWINSKQESAEDKGLTIDDIDVYVNIVYDQPLGSSKKNFFVSGVESKAFIVDSE